ncbi:MAG: glycosyltransferase family 2 protein [Bacteroidota bacterium]
MPDNRITVVMITRNRGDQIRTALGHLQQLPEHPRLIVVDNGSSDGTVAVARSMGAPVEVLALHENLGSGGRNVGVSKATTPYVAFSDDDSWWQPGALSRAADLFDADPTLGLLAARILVGPDQKLDPLSHAMATSPLAGPDSRSSGRVGVPIVGFAACGTVIRRSAFLETGGFERRFGVGGEEQVLALDLLRKGWQMVYVDEIVAYHHPSPVRDPAKRMRHEVRNALWSAWLRRPARSAWAATRQILRSALGDPSRLAGVRDAFAGLPWILPSRRPVPVEIDCQLQQAEEAWIASSQLETFQS